MGLALATISYLADTLGVGGQPGIMGWKQIAGLAAGGLMVLAGGWVILAMQRQVSHSEARPAQAAPMSYAVDAPIYDSAAPRVPFIHELQELVRYRYLLWNLISRDLKVRYKRSALGVVWTMVNPLLTMAVMAVVFMNIFRFQVANYPIYLLSGILLWRLFAVGTTNAMRSVLGHSEIRKKIYVPASVFVASSIGSALVNLLLAMIPLLLLAIVLGVRPQLTWLYLPIPILQTTLLAFGVGVMIAALAVFFADMIDIYEVFTTAYFYLTPIIYPASILPIQLQDLEVANPMFHFAEGFRLALLEGTLPNWQTLMMGTVPTFVLTVLGWSLFTRLSDEFAYRA